MDNLIKKLKELETKVVEAKNVLNISKKKERVEELNFLINKEGFWQNNEEAVKLSQEVEDLRKEINSFEDLEKDISDMKELAVLSNESQDDSFYNEINLKFKDIEKRFEKLEFLLLFSSDDDNKNSIVSIHAGTGGVDAQDWAEMLERMYLRFAEKKGFKVELLDRVVANEAGIKNSTFKVSGAYAYGYLKSENGVHRLVRISPFDAEGMRHTSFAGVEVLPEVSDTSVELKEGDLRIDVYKSSGPGGQSVNTTDSAVRIVHIPTNISVSCQSERSQHQNKERALGILKAKLYKLQEEKKDEENKKIKGDAGQGTWGKQIRSYVFQPYQMVKDHRTDFSTSDISSVMDGDLNSFIESYLTLILKNKNK
jgi:peptide chain release factor 2